MRYPMAEGIELKTLQLRAKCLVNELPASALFISIRLVNSRSAYYRLLRRAASKFLLTGGASTSFCGQVEAHT